MNLSIDEITASLRKFVSRRDDLLHEDVAGFDHHLDRFLEFCGKNELTQKILGPIQQSVEVDIDKWWEQLSEKGEVAFPADENIELITRYGILESVQKNPQLIFNFGIAIGKSKRSEAVELFRSLVIRPLVDDLSHQIGEAADMASPEERALQAVPLNRIPKINETKLFLSHKSEDKVIVLRYYNALKEVGYEPWLDEPEMPAGSNLEREIFKGFSESCAAIFFITENFADEKFLAAEVDYAVMQKRKKGDKFVIITLRYPNSAPVPKLLTPYIYKDVENDLEGFHEIIRALPVELGPTRWKEKVVEK